MTPEEMVNYINISTSAFDSLKLLVLTGGEVFTQKFSDILIVIHYAKFFKGLRTRIVSNGFWATSYKKTCQILRLLVQAGLDELNISTGDNHCKFVEMSHILNIAKAQSDTGLLDELCFAVEDHGDKTIITSQEISKEISKQYTHLNKICVIKSPWIEGHNRYPFVTTSSTSERDTKDIANTVTQEGCHTGCENLTNGIQISPTGQLLACCGFASEYSPILKLGNVERHSKGLKEYLSHSSNDLLLILLRTIGPRKIIEMLGEKQTNPNIHECEICLFLLRNPYYLSKLFDLSKSEIEGYILYHHFITN